MTYRLN